MHTGFKDRNHIYAMEVLNDKGEWVRHMYDIPIDIASIKKYLSITTDWDMQTIKLEL